MKCIKCRCNMFITKYKCNGKVIDKSYICPNCKWTHYEFENAFEVDMDGNI